MFSPRGSPPKSGAFWRSIRGEFDLSSADSHQWATSLQLTFSDRCVLSKKAHGTGRAALDIYVPVPKIP